MCYIIYIRHHYRQREKGQPPWWPPTSVNWALPPWWLNCCRTHKRTNPSPGFQALVDDRLLKKHRIVIEIALKIRTRILLQKRPSKNYRRKSFARILCLVTPVVVSCYQSWCNVRKFKGKQHWKASYRVKKAECYKVPRAISSDVDTIQFTDSMLDSSDEEKFKDSWQPSTP